MKGVELYGRVRYAVQIEGLSHREAARQFGIDPRTVAKMVRFLHALTLHFDRTVRQFPKWREFVRNAERDRLTPGQVAEVPVLAQAMVDALRDEDAHEFIDPPIPAALEKLQAPLKADSKIAAQAQLPAIRTEGLLLAEDTPL